MEDRTTMDKRHLDRIRLLSTRFHSLQGLRVALFGALVATVVGGYVIASPQPTNNGAMIALSAAAVLFFAAQPSLNRYYAETFGRQVWTRSRYWPLILIAYWTVATYFNTTYPQIPSGAPTMVTVALASIVIAIRDWPWRAYYLGVTTAVVIGFGASAPITGFLAPNMTLGALFFLFGVSIVPVGLLDHRLLVKLMNEAREPLAERASTPRP
jgi:hypothetical protein